MLAYTSLITAAGAHLWIWSSIWLNGSVTGREDNLIIRSFESGLFFVFLIIGIERFIHICRESRKLRKYKQEEKKRYTR